jgi:hypothetical protein
MRQDIVSLLKVYHVTTNSLLMVMPGVEALALINSCLSLAVIVLQDEVYASGKSGMDLLVITRPCRIQ